MAKENFTYWERYKRMREIARVIAQKQQPTPMIFMPFMSKFFSMLVSSFVVVLALAPGKSSQGLIYADYIIRWFFLTLGGGYTAFKVYKEIVKPWIKKKK